MKEARRKHVFHGESGVSILEIIVAAAILLVIAMQISQGFSNNLEARARAELTREYLAVDNAVKSAAFRKVTSLVESGISCKKPAKAFGAAWAAQSYRSVRMSLLNKPRAGIHPKEVLKRCGSQTHSGPVREGFYFCLDLKAGPEAAQKSFLAKNDAYAEVFYGFWDVANDRAIDCAVFNDASTPVRGGRLFYTIYWRPKKAKQGEAFQRQAGIMYGQTKAP